jgi:autotransporter-associated beta strand protein
VSGSLTIDGAGSSFTGYVNQMTGTISVTNGGLLSTGLSGGDPTGFRLDFTQGSGSLTVAGQGSRWVNTLSDVYLYNSSVAPIKVALMISDGGAADIGGRLIVQRGATVTVDRGTLAVSSLQDAGPAASSGSFVAISDAPGGGSALILQGGGNSGADFGFNGLIKDAASGPGSITVASGFWYLNNIANTYSGGTYLNGGILRAKSGGTLGSGGLYFNGGTLYVEGDATFGAGKPVTFGSNGGRIGAFGNGTLTIAQNLAVGGPLTVDGGTVRLTGVNTFAGPIRLADGALALVSDVDQTIGVVVSGAGSNGNLIKGGTGTLTLTQASPGMPRSTVDGGAIRLQNGDALYGSLLTLNKNNGMILDFADTTPLRLGGLAGSGDLAIGAHNLILQNTGNNTYGTPVYGGAISGTGSVTFNLSTRLTGKSTYTGGTVVDNGASLYLRTDSLVGDIDSTVFGRLFFEQDTDGTFAGSISTNLLLYKSGTGTVSLPNAASRYTVTGGTLAAGLSNLGNQTVQVYNGATFRALSGGSIFWFEAYEGVGTIDTNGFDVTAQALYSNPLTSSFIKTGDGALIVEGIANPASVEVRGGALELGAANNTDMRILSRITVGSGAELRGSATLVNGVTLESGGVLSPGRPSVPGESGIFAGTSLVWNDGGLLRFNLVQDGTGELITLTGALTKGLVGANGFFFDFANSTVQDGTRYTLLSFASTNFFASDFGYRNLPGGFTGGFEMDGNNLYFRAGGGGAVVVPEPGTLPLLLTISPVAVALAARRRIRH